MSWTKLLTLFVLNGPGAIFKTEIFRDEYSFDKDLSKLENPALKDEEINKKLSGSFIIEDDK